MPARSLVFTRLLSVLKIIALGSVASVYLPMFNSAAAAEMGFVLTYRHFSIYETKGGHKECPNGFSADQLSSWKAQFPTEELRKAHLRKYISIFNRGENGENVLLHPHSRHDSKNLLKEIEGNIAYGLDLDEATDSERPANSCSHREFMDPEKNAGIDNQLYRAIGCYPFFRSGGLSPVFSEKYLLETPGLRLLMKISGLDDELNDDYVEVTFYRGQDDPLRLDASGNPIPWQSFRIDGSTPDEHIYRAIGKIEKGVLTTEPIDFWYTGSSVEHIRDMRLKLEMSATEAAGLMGGYWDLRQLIEGTYFLTAAGGPAMYDALYRLADGYRNAETGQCTAISSAQAVRFTRAYLIHPAMDQKTDLPEMETAAITLKIDMPEPNNVVMPAGVGIRMTDEGPVFVNAEGMTLYKTSMDSASGTIKSNCTYTPVKTLRTVTREGSNLGFEISLPDAKKRKSCAHKHPPLLAERAAKPIGKWTPFARDDGSMQWAYEGAPLYTSIKDMKPGDTNGGYHGTDRFNARYPWSVVHAPLVGFPPGLTAQKSTLGVVLMNHAGKTLYVSNKNVSPRDSGCHGECAFRWKPLEAPAAAADIEYANWSVLKRIDGVNQWAYRGMPLYTYAEDTRISDISVPATATVFGSAYGNPIPGWHPVVLEPAPAHPDSVTVQFIHYGKYNRFEPERVYADAEGNTLYTFHCIENTDDRLDCDDPGDNPIYWRSFCGSNCSEIWSPFVARGGADSVGNNWSVIRINSNNPWQPIPPGESGIAVWAYKGRPVYTYAADTEQARLNGTKENLNPSISAISAYAE